MTWTTFFDLTTMQSRHLLASYAVVILLQGGYFIWTAWNWRTTKRPRL